MSGQSPTSTPTSGESVLVNYLYWPPVGHALEGMRIALGHRAAGGGPVTVLLHPDTPWQLGQLGRGIDLVRPILLPDDEIYDERMFAGIDRQFDYIVNNHQRWPATDFPEKFRAVYAVANRYFTARVARWRKPGDQAVPYIPHQQLCLELPEAAQARAQHMVVTGGPQIAVILAGSGSGDSTMYPAVASWELLLDALVDQYPGLGLHFIGRLAPAGTTSTTTRANVCRILGPVPRQRRPLRPADYRPARHTRARRPPHLPAHRVRVRGINSQDTLARDIRGAVLRVLLQRCSEPFNPT